MNIGPIILGNQMEAPMDNLNILDGTRSCGVFGRQCQSPGRRSLLSA
jgi:hypothetical protein